MMSMEIFILIAMGLIFGAHNVIIKHFKGTHRTMIIVWLIVGFLSLIFGMSWMIAFFVFCFAFYTMMCAFRRTKNSNNIPALPVIFTVITFFIFMFLAAEFNSIATFFLASVCLCYWWVQYMKAI